MNHPLFQDGILQDTGSITTFSQTHNFHGGLTPILCTNQDNYFQLRFFARQNTPRINDPRYENTKTSWNQDILITRQNFSMAVKLQVYFLPRHVLVKIVLQNYILEKTCFGIFHLGRHILRVLFLAKTYIGSCCPG